VKVIENITIRYSAYDFLATMGLSRTVSEIDGDLSRKSQNFPTLVFCVQLKGFPSELGTGAWGQKKLE